MTTSLGALAPEIVLTLAALLLLAGEGFFPGRRALWLTLAGAAVVLAGIFAAQPVASPETVLGMMVRDGMARYFRLFLLGGVFLVLAMSADHGEFQPKAGRPGFPGWGAYGALLLFSATGLLLLVSAVDFILILVALELISISSFILTGFLKEQRRSSEAAIKFFLVGAFSTGLMIYGISLVYGIFGSTSLSSLSAVGAEVPPAFLMGALLFILAGFGFKLGLAPFHMWIPDAYEGAPTPITAYLSVAPKAAALAVVVRTFSNHAQLGLSPVLAVLSAVTMTVGNLSALKQTNVKRLLGYSSIAQIGTIVLGFAAAEGTGSLGTISALFYAFSYLVMNLGAFACVIAVTNESGTEELDGFSGLSQRSLPLALATTVFLLSLTGIPPLIGFMGKFSVFAAAVSRGMIWLAVVGVLNSVVSLYYYFGIIRRMFFEKPLKFGPVSIAPLLRGCMIVTFTVTLGLGLFPDGLLGWIRSVVP